jgi:hypothetical protein
MKIFSVLALSAFTFVAACAVSPSDSDGASGEEGSAQDLSANKLNLSGSWVRSADEFGGFGSKALYLGPNGKFFQDAAPILLGVQVPAPKNNRSTGTFAIDTSKKTLTLNYADTSDKVTYHYDFTPARIILGVFAPGSSAPVGGVAKLALTRQVKSEPGAAVSQIAFPTETYEFAPSYCISDADCDREKADKTWEPISSGKSHCQLDGDVKDSEIGDNVCMAVVE